ncbi:MAG: hypothetical protein HZA37_01690 [Parcubacteria group bacterium]|nr:hypothetical protein [Parcubacteria group bacterium]
MKVWDDRIIKGFRVTVFYPTSRSREELLWRVVVSKDGRQVHQIVIPIMINYSDKPHEEDIWNLEARLDELLPPLLTLK